VQYEPIVISLPIADRRVSYDFYRGALQLTAQGEPAGDGVPEPLRLVLNAGVHLMLVPQGGFGWTLGGGQVSPAGQHECVLVLTTASRAETDALVERAVGAGGRLVAAPAQQPWGYNGTFTDPDGHLWMVHAAEAVPPA
jgi:uncharacterized protein